MNTIQVQLPDSVLEHARKLAEQDQIPLDYFVALAITERVSAQRGMAYIRERAMHFNRDEFLAAMAKSGDADPIPSDRID
jgi:hypothetical protein